MKRRRIGGAFVTLYLLLNSVWPCAAAPTRWQQVLSFDFPSVRYIEVFPTFYPAPHVENQTLHFAPFDPSLGTLKNAFLSYQGTYGVEYVVKAGFRPLTPWEAFNDTWYWGKVSALAHYTFSLGLTAPGAGAPVRSTIHSEEMGTYVADWCLSDKYGTWFWYDIDGSGPKGPPKPDNEWFDFDGSYQFQPWVTSGSLDTPLLSRADGLDVLGGPVDVTLDKSITQFLVPLFSSCVDPAYSTLDNYLNRWYGQIALTYEYETIPEPSTLLLVCTGLVSLTATRKVYPMWSRRNP